VYPLHIIFDYTYAACLYAAIAVPAGRYLEVAKNNLLDLCALAGGSGDSLVEQPVGIAT
jgi:hypothetical protein